MNKQGPHLAGEHKLNGAQSLDSVLWRKQIGIGGILCSGTTGMGGISIPVLKSGSGCFLLSLFTLQRLDIC